MRNLCMTGTHKKIRAWFSDLPEKQLLVIAWIGTLQVTQSITYYKGAFGEKNFSPNAPHNSKIMSTVI